MFQNSIIWWNGALVPWGEAKVHVTSETALRGLNVFEGMRAYWRSAESCYAIVALDWHLDRLEESARLLQIPASGVRERILQGIYDLLGAISDPSDLYIRPTIYVDSGGYEVDPERIVIGEFISWRKAPAQPERSMRCGVSSWVHIPANSLPPNAKIGASYTAFRLARMEVVAKGLDEAILLNDNDEVTETPGGSILILNGKTVSTPPLNGGILPSITRRIVLDELCPQLGLVVKERVLRVEDLRRADAVIVVGTLDEISKVQSIDDHYFQDNHPAKATVCQLATLFRTICDGSQMRSCTWIHLVPISAA